MFYETTKIEKVKAKLNTVIKLFQRNIFKSAATTNV